MSKNNYLSNFTPQDMITYGNSLGLLYLYYSLSELGSDLNKKIGTLAKVLKSVNRNVNVIDMHLKKHLITHKTDLDIDENDYNYEYIKRLEERIKILEEKFEESEHVTNPMIIQKKIKIEKDSSPDFISRNGDETQPLWSK